VPPRLARESGRLGGFKVFARERFGGHFLHELPEVCGVRHPPGAVRCIVVRYALRAEGDVRRELLRGGERFSLRESGADSEHVGKLTRCVNASIAIGSHDRFPF